MRTYAPIDPRNRLRVVLAPNSQDALTPTGVSNMVVMAGDIRVTLEVRHDPDGDYLRVVTDAPYSSVQLRAESISLRPDDVPDPAKGPPKTRPPGIAVMS